MISPKAILFDLDGTLTDRRASLARFAEGFRIEYSSCLLSLDDSDLLTVLHRGDGGGYRARTELCSDLIQYLPWTSPPTLDELLKFWWAEFPQSTVAAEGIPEILRTLSEQGLLFGIVSNGGSRMQNAKIDVMGLRSFMKTVLISEDVGVEKPSPEIFLKALEVLGVNAHETVFVGDDPTRDIDGAWHVGLVPVWVRLGRDWPRGRPSPYYEVDSLTELPALLH